MSDYVVAEQHLDENGVWWIQLQGKGTAMKDMTLQEAASIVVAVAHGNPDHVPYSYEHIMQAICVVLLPQALAADQIEGPS